MIAVTTLAALLRLVYLGRESLWLDEFFSVAFADLDWRTLWKVLSTTEANMALYYCLLHLWIGLGQSEAVIRGLSAVTGLMTVPVIYALGKRMFGARVALLAALLLAANTFHIKYSQEARAYSLVVLLTTLSCLFFFRAMERQSRSDWAWYVVTGTLAVYSHVFALLVLGSGWVSLVMLPPRKVPWRRLLVSVALIGFLCAPLAVYLLKNGIAGHLDWVPKPTLFNVASLFSSFAGAGPGPRLLRLAYSVPCFAAFVYAVWAWRYSKSELETWHYGFLFSWLFIPVLIALAASVRQPIFVDRFLIVCLPPFVLLTAIGFSQVHSRWILAGALAVLMILLSRNVMAYYSLLAKEDWRGSTSYVISRASSADGIMFYLSADLLAFDYYVRLAGRTGAVGKVIYPGRIDWKTSAEPDEPSYTQLLEQYHRVWLFESHHILNQMQEQKIRSMRAVLASKYPDVSEKKFRDVDVVLYSMDERVQSPSLDKIP